jgi:glycine C-acetyltransferase
VTGSRSLVDFLRERAPMYIYSNPITVGEASAATAALSVVDSGEGRLLLAHLGALTGKLEMGLVGLGLETIPGPHPIVPLMVRDTDRTSGLVRNLFDNGVLATGLNFPVVPKGDEEIRFQVNADHTESDIDQLLEVLTSFPG